MEPPNLTESELPLSAYELWGEAYERSLNRSVIACDDLFRYVCDGFIRSTLSSSAENENSNVWTMMRAEQALKLIVLERLKEIGKMIRDEYKTEEYEAESEYEAFKFFDSCLSSDSSEHRRQSRAVLKKLFGDLGIDWFRDGYVKPREGGYMRARLQSCDLELNDTFAAIDLHDDKASASLRTPRESITQVQQPPAIRQNVELNATRDPIRKLLRRAAKSSKVTLKISTTREDFRNNRTAAWKYLKSLGVPPFDVTTELRKLQNVITAATYAIAVRNTIREELEPSTLSKLASRTGLFG